MSEVLKEWMGLERPTGARGALTQGTRDGSAMRLTDSDWKGYGRRRRGGTEGGASKM